MKCFSAVLVGFSLWPNSYIRFQKTFEIYFSNWHFKFCVIRNGYITTWSLKICCFFVVFLILLITLIFFLQQRDPIINISFNNRPKYIFLKSINVVKHLKRYDANEYVVYETLQNKNQATPYYVLCSVIL